MRDLGNPRWVFLRGGRRQPSSRKPPGADKKEGAFYTWTSSALAEALGAEAALFARAYGVRPEGNVADGAGEFAGENILFRRGRRGRGGRFRFDGRGRRPAIGAGRRCWVCAVRGPGRSWTIKF